MKLDSNKRYMITINFEEMTFYQRLIFAFNIILKKWTGLKTDIVEIKEKK